MHPKSLLAPLLITLLLFLSACSVQNKDDSLTTATAPEAVPQDTVSQAPQNPIAATGAETRPQLPSEPEYADIFERLEASFKLPSCEIDKTSQKWAQWYADHPDYMARVLKRAEPWLFYIAEEIEKRNLPGEFAYLPIVESAFDPFAYSHMNAAGTWQFIASTGKQYGLQQNWWYDGRRDMYAATQAALDYLSYLGDRFDEDWLLALASYNAGEGRVGRLVKKQKARNQPADFWNLKLPKETRGYVPKMLGLRCLFANPEKYDFTLPDIPNTPRVVVIDIGTQTDLVLAAQLAGMSITDLYALNPGYSRWATAPNGPHRIVLPRLNAENMTVRLADLEPEALMRWDYVSVAPGDTLDKLAIKHNVPIEVIRATNNLSSDVISINQRLQLPREGIDRIDPLYAAAAIELQKMQNRLVAPTRINHRIRNGESLSTIAKRYRVRVSDIQRWNGISDPGKIRAGKNLKIFKSKAGGSSYGSKKSGETQYTVRRGDSLWKIAKKHRVKIDDLKRWNNLNSKSILRPGQKLTLVL
ncbi:MAG: LysM peptidoglycan-binding domain-containing protein [Xanthomonadales bacterium]|nr:LysM peptidoglycan-binding domain-containing protein [Xanthomonadales bacterium]